MVDEPKKNAIGAIANQGKGPKCFACKCYGHIAKSCPNKKKVTAATINMGVDTNVVGSTLMKVDAKRVNRGIKRGSIVECEVNDMKCDSLLDTGSPVDMISTTLISKLGLNILNQE